jgi:hypothetical protein
MIAPKTCSCGSMPIISLINNQFVVSCPNRACPVQPVSGNAREFTVQHWNEMRREKNLAITTPEDLFSKKSLDIAIEKR